MEACFTKILICYNRLLICHKTLVISYNKLENSIGVALLSAHACGI